MGYNKAPCDSFSASLFWTASNLGFNDEGSSQGQVLDKLGCFVHGSDSIIMLAVLSHPHFVLLVPVRFLRGERFLVCLDILQCLSDISFSFREGVRVIVTHLRVRSNLGLVVVDRIVQVVQDSIASAHISSSHIVVLRLVLVQPSDDFVQKHVHLLSRTLRLHVHLDC